MTTERLIELVRRYPAIRDVKLQLDDDDITVPGSWAQEEILRRVEPLIATGTITLLPGQQLYTYAIGPPIVNAWLLTAGRILPVAYPTVETNLFLALRDIVWVDKDRSRVGAGGSKSLPPRFFFLLDTNPRTIGIWYTPDTAFDVNFRYYRRHASADNLTADPPAVDPILQDDLEELLVVSTVAKIFEMRLDKFGTQFKVAFDRHEKLIQEKMEQYRVANFALLQAEGLLW